MMMTSEHLSELTRLVTETVAEELDCDAVLDRLAALLEHAVGAELSPELAAVGQHLQVCPDCHEEYQALLSVYEESS